MMRLEWKVFISSKPCRLIVVPRQEFIKHMFGKLLFFFVFPKLGISYKAKKASWTVCITPHSAMDNTIHSIWKSKSSFPTSCKQCCPQLHKTGSYTHYTQRRRLRNPTPSFFPFYISQKKFLQTRPFSGKILSKSN